MGLHLNLTPLIADTVATHALRGAVCTLGVQDLPFDCADLDGALRCNLQRSGKADAASFFSALGFSSTEALDFSDYEGAEHVFDLNEPSLPAALQNRFDLVFNGGTLEHVFHVPNALSSISKMLRPGGTVMHLAPCNNWCEHGFYQISPTLMFDYYAAAGFDVLGSFLCRYTKENDKRWRIEPSAPGILPSGAAGALNADICLLLFAARRGETIVASPQPVQRLYAGNPIDLVA
jgi:hypothetical protein